MATQISHVVLTAKIFDKFFKDKIRKDFFIGSLFPDIQTLKVIDRDKTHFNNLEIGDLNKDTSFMAGVKFHSILDLLRQNYVREHDIYALCPESKYIIISLKILEEQILYSYVDNWKEYTDYLNEILPEEISFGVDEVSIKKWHSLMQQHFKSKPNEQTEKNIMLQMGYSEEVIDEINENIRKMRANKKITILLKNLYKNFDVLIMQTEKYIT